MLVGAHDKKRKNMEDQVSEFLVVQMATYIRKHSIKELMELVMQAIDCVQGERNGEHKQN